MKLVSHEKNTEASSEDWETPPELFKALNEVFNFRIDLAASSKNSLCENYFGPDHESDEMRDALTIKWSEWLKHQAGFCNPPFSLWAEFAEKCLVETAGSFTTVLCIPPRLDTKAFHLIMPFADEMIIPEGRVQYLLDGVRPKRLNKQGKEVTSGNGAATAFFVFRPRLQKALYGNPRTVFWNPNQEWGL